MNTYALLKLVHVSAAVTSGSLFALRGILILSGRELGRHPVARYASYAIDTILLTAALLLLATLRINPLSTPWLAMKLTLVLLYIGLGIRALRPGRPASRAIFLVAALLVFMLIIRIAHTHDPWGALH